MKHKTIPIGLLVNNLSNKKEIEKNKEMKLFYSYIKKLTHLILSSDEYYVFWEVIENNKKQVALAKIMGTDKTKICKLYNGALDKIKPHANIVVDVFELKSLYKGGDKRGVDRYC